MKIQYEQLRDDKVYIKDLQPLAFKLFNNENNNKIEILKDLC